MWDKNINMGYRIKFANYISAKVKQIPLPNFEYFIYHFLYLKNINYLFH